MKITTKTMAKINQYPEEIELSTVVVDVDEIWVWVWAVVVKEL